LRISGLRLRAAGLLANEGRHVVRRNRKDILRVDPIHAMPPESFDMPGARHGPTRDRRIGDD
jgi:hypothetical protein